MAVNYYQHATDIVNKFKAELSSEQAALLSSTEEEKLTRLIAAAIAAEVLSAADQVEELARELRSRVSKPDLGM